MRRFKRTASLRATQRDTLRIIFLGCANRAVQLTSAILAWNYQIPWRCMGRRWASLKRNLARTDLYPLQTLRAAKASTLQTVFKATTRRLPCFASLRTNQRLSSYTVTEGPPTYPSHAVKPFPLQNGRRILFAVGCAAESVQPTPSLKETNFPEASGLNRKKPASYLLLQAVPLPRAAELTTSNTTILNTRRFAPRATIYSNKTPRR